MHTRSSMGGECSPKRGRKNGAAHLKTAAVEDGRDGGGGGGGGGRHGEKAASAVVALLCFGLLLLQQQLLGDGRR